MTVQAALVAMALAVPTPSSFNARLAAAIASLGPRFPEFAAFRPETALKEGRILYEYRVSHPPNPDFEAQEARYQAMVKGDPSVQMGPPSRTLMVVEEGGVFLEVEASWNLFNHAASCAASKPEDWKVVSQNQGGFEYGDLCGHRFNLRWGLDAASPTRGAQLRDAIMAVIKRVAAEFASSSRRYRPISGQRSPPW